MPLKSILNEYELVLNPKKTSIAELPVPASALWASELSVVPIRTSARGQSSDIIRFFDRAFELSKNYNDENVMKYAISKLNSVVIDKLNWPLVEGYILQIIAVEPGAMPLGLRKILEHKTNGYVIDSDRIAFVLNKIIERHVPLGHGSEIAWAIWGCIEFGLNIENANTQLCLNYEDSMVLLLISDAICRNLVQNSGSLDYSVTASKLNATQLYDSHWLFCYEADLKNWFQTSLAAINSDPAYKLLHSAGVSFYDESATMLNKPISKIGTSGGYPH